MGHKEKHSFSWMDTLAPLHGKNKLKRRNCNLSHLEIRVCSLRGMEERRS